MKLIKINSITNGSRHQLNLQKKVLSKKSRILKSLSIGLKCFGGRSSQTGHITVRHKGSGCKKSFKFITFSNNEFYSIVLTTLYDAKRTAFVALNFNLVSNTFFYTLSTEGVLPGSIVCCNNFNLELKLGYRLPLRYIPAGSLIHSISVSDQKQAVFARSAGAFCQIIQKDFQKCKIKLPSGQIIQLSVGACGTIGLISNLKHNLCIIGKAGRNRLKGKRPSVRGIAMNPVDHPHGGRSNGGKPSVTPWGMPTKGYPTVKKKLYL